MVSHILLPCLCEEMYHLLISPKYLFKNINIRDKNERVRKLHINKLKVKYLN